MRVVLSTAGKFHMFALARELARADALVQIYTGFPWRVVGSEGVPRNLVTTMPLVRPVLMGLRYLPFDVPRSFRDFLHSASLETLDRYVSTRAPACDVFVGHEGAGLVTGRKLKKRGSRYVVDRGCSHIAEQTKLLEDEYDRLGIPGFVEPVSMQRELAEYHIADHIIVGSSIARKSFLDRGFSPDRVTSVNYGVAMKVVDQPLRKASEEFRILFAGRLSIRKGAIDLVKSFLALPVVNKTLTIVGTIEPAIRSLLGSQLDDPRINVVGHQPHTVLRNTMAKSHVLILPSIEEGFGMVVAEAMANACPVIVSENVGATDIVIDAHNGFVVPIRSPDWIMECCLKLAQQPDLQVAMSEHALATARALSGWAQYGQRVLLTLQKAVAQGPK